MVVTDSTDGIEILSFRTDRINALNVDVIRPVILKLFETTTTRTVQGETTAPPVLGLSEGTDLDRLEALTERLAGMREARGHEQ